MRNNMLQFTVLLTLSESFNHSNCVCVWQYKSLLLEYCWLSCSLANSIYDCII